MDSRRRFTSRVDHSVRYRPAYPPQVVTELQTACGLGEGSRVDFAVGQAFHWFER